MIGVQQQQQRNAVAGPSTILNIPASEASLTFADTGLTSGNNQIWEIFIDIVGTDGSYVGNQQVNGFQFNGGSGPQPTFDSFDGTLTNRYLFLLPPSTNPTTYTGTWGIIADGAQQASKSLTFPAHSTTGVTTLDIGTPRTLAASGIAKGYGVSGGTSLMPYDLEVANNISEIAPKLQSGKTVLANFSGKYNYHLQLNGVSNARLMAQTAPGDGILLHAHNQDRNVVSYGGASFVRISGLRFAVLSGPYGNFDAVRGEGPLADHLLFDHCEIKMGRDQLLNVSSGRHDVTFKDCIIGPSMGVLNDNGLESGRGPLIDGGATRVAFVDCLFAGVRQRQIRAKNGASVLMSNCVVAAWYQSFVTDISDSAKANVEYCVYIPNTSNSSLGQNYILIKSGAQVYAVGNTTHASGFSTTLDQNTMINNSGGTVASSLVGDAHGVTPQFTDPTQIMDYVRDNVGANPGRRDADQAAAVDGSFDRTFARNESYTLGPNDLTALNGGPTRIDDTRPDKTDAEFRAYVGMTAADDARTKVNAQGVPLMEVWWEWLNQKAA